LKKLMNDNLGLKDWDMSSSTALYNSCQAIYKKYGTTLGLCVEMMTMRAGMKQAEYFIYGSDEPEEDKEPDDPEDPHHFALNFEYYTHFTSPIRRYPDVMVHRVLCSLLEGRLEPVEGLENFEEEEEEEEEEDEAKEAKPKKPKGPVYFQSRELAKEQVGTCNSKKTASRRCQEQLDRAVFCIYLRSLKAWFYTVGTVLAFHRTNKEGGDTVTVYCAQLGRESKARLCKAHEEELEGSIELFTEGVQDELMLPHDWNWKGRGAVELIWKAKSAGGDEGDAEEEQAEDDTPKKVQALKTLSCVPIVIIPTNTVPIDYAVYFVSPFHPKFEEVKATISADEERGFDWTEVDEEGVDVLFDEDDNAAPAMD